MTHPHANPRIAILSQNEQAPAYRWGRSVSIPFSHDSLVQVAELRLDRQRVGLLYHARADAYRLAHLRVTASRERR